MEKCDHKKPNADLCEICKDIFSLCHYAEKEGFASFDDCFDKNNKLTKEGWKRMVDYYNKSQTIDPSDWDYEVEGINLDEETYQEDKLSI